MYTKRLSLMVVVFLFAGCRFGGNSIDQSELAADDKDKPATVELYFEAPESYLSVELLKHWKKKGYTAMKDDCLKPVKKSFDEEELIWFQQFLKPCDHPDVIDGKGIAFEMVGTISRYEVNEAILGKVGASLLTQMLKSSSLFQRKIGYLFLPEYPDEAIGMWSQTISKDNRSAGLIGALCNFKPATTEPITSYFEKIDFSDKCDVIMKNGFVVGIKAKFKTNYQANNAEAVVDNSSQGRGQVEQPVQQQSTKRSRGFVSDKSGCTILSCQRCMYRDIHNDMYVCHHSIEAFARNCAWRACVNDVGMARCFDKGCVSDNVNVWGNGNNRDVDYEHSSGVAQSTSRSIFGSDFTCTYHSFSGVAYTYTHPLRGVADFEAYGKCLRESALKVCTFHNCKPY